MKYSLADYILSIKTNDTSLTRFGTITVGGEGSAVGSIDIEISDTMFETTSFATGAWVHDKNLARTGTADVELSQLSNQVAKFIQLCNVFYGQDYQGLTLQLSDSQARAVATCEDCYIKKIPKQGFGPKATNQTWSFTCGKITFA